MYKYSKKAEEQLFKNSCFAYFFYQFAQCEEGKSYIQNKLEKTSLFLDDEGKLNQPHSCRNQKLQKFGQQSKSAALEALDKQAEMNERIVSEIHQMSLEAKQNIIYAFKEDIERIFLQNQNEIKCFDDYKAIAKRSLITYALLENIKVDVTVYLRKKFDQLFKPEPSQLLVSQSQKSETEQKPVGSPTQKSDLLKLIPLIKKITSFNDTQNIQLTPIKAVKSVSADENSQL